MAAVISLVPPCCCWRLAFASPSFLNNKLHSAFFPPDAAATKPQPVNGGSPSAWRLHWIYEQLKTCEWISATPGEPIGLESLLLSKCKPYVAFHRGAVAAPAITNTRLLLTYRNLSNLFISNISGASRLFTAADKLKTGLQDFIHAGNETKFYRSHPKQQEANS